MKSCIEITGGCYVTTVSFGDPVFKGSFRKFFEVDDNAELKMGFSAQVKAFTSQDFKVSGAIG